MSFLPGNAPRSWRQANRADVLILGAALAFAAWFVWRTFNLNQHTWNWQALLPYIALKNSQGQWQPGLLSRGLFTTLRLSLWSLLLALIIGTLVGTLSVRLRGLAALPARLYINAVRNTPPLVLLFLIYFFAGSFFTTPLLSLESLYHSLPSGLQSTLALLFAPPEQWDRMLAAVLTLGLYEGAYMAEIIRAGIESVPQAQWDASASQGLSPWQQRRYIIAPQALAVMLPALVGQSLSTFKDTALASLVSVPELTFQSLEVMAISRMTFELWIFTAGLYLLLSLLLTSLARRHEKKRKWRMG